MNSGLNLGQFIDELKKLPPKANIEFDFGGAAPTVLDSYRGYYDELALGYDGSYGAELPTVKQMLKDAESAIGKTFSGWKGGDYVMRKNTSIFVANPGNTSETYIKGIRKKYDDWYTIETDEEYDD